MTKFQKIRVRFAPSPTGYLHIGGLRTALFNYLFAKKRGGSVILRIEDTDRSRYVEGAVESLLESLEWAGLEFDEGLHGKFQAPNSKLKIFEAGENGPYFQSRRLDIYKKYSDILIKKGFAYWCGCSHDRLDALRKDQQKRGEPTMYDRKCRNLGLKFEKGRVLRLKVPIKDTKSQIPNSKLATRFTDLVKGEIAVKNSTIDDQILLKSDGFPTYHLSAVVDDHLMGITHVIRGDEWLISTPKHVLLYEAFGWDLPVFAHLPLILAPDKSKLSKRHGSVSVDEFRKEGYLPEALINFVALLGWHPQGDEEIFSLEELVNIFDISRVQKSPAIFNREKLDSLNAEYIRGLSLDDFAKKCEPFLEYNNANFEYIKKAVSTEQARIKKLSEIGEGTEFFFEDPSYEPNLLVWKKLRNNPEYSNDEQIFVFIKKNLAILSEYLQDFGEEEWTEELLEKNIMEFIEKNNLDVGSILWPMRVSLTGRKASPGPFEVAYVLGKEKTLERLHTAEDML